MSISDMELLSLSQLANSTRTGAIDRGNPITYKKLESQGYAKAKDGGYIVAEEGLAYLKLHKNKLYGPKKREKKPKKAERIERDGSDDFSYEDFSFNE